MKLGPPTTNCTRDNSFSTFSGVRFDLSYSRSNSRSDWTNQIRIKFKVKLLSNQISVLISWYRIRFFLDSTQIKSSHNFFFMLLWTNANNMGGSTTSLRGKAHILVSSCSRKILRVFRKSILHSLRTVSPF